MSIPLLEWDAPGPYRVAFSTRLGGISTGPYESLNLGRLTADRPQDVRRNRAALKEQLGVQLAYIRQVHGTDVRRVIDPPVEPTDAIERLRAMLERQ